MPTQNPITTDTTNRKAKIQIDRESLITALGLPKSLKIHKAEWVNESVLELVISHKDIQELETPTEDADLPMISFSADEVRPRFIEWHQ